MLRVFDFIIGNGDVDVKMYNYIKPRNVRNVDLYKNSEDALDLLYYE